MTGEQIGMPTVSNSATAEFLLFHTLLQLIFIMLGARVMGSVFVRLRQPRGVGEIVVTNLGRRLMPIIRYRTGDLGRRVAGTCQCGRLGPRFELLGRCDDVLRVGSVSIYPESIEPVLASVPELSRLFQIVAERDGVKDRLTVRTESPLSDEGARKALEPRLAAMIIEADEELAEALREGWLGMFSVEVLPSGGIPRVRRTGKIRRVIDLRP